jgi:hypothetical protein
MRFDYTVLDGSFERPYAEIRVSYRDRSRRYMVLVDSGADINVFSAELAAILGIDLKRGEALTVRGATGQSETFYVHPITLSVGDVAFPTTAAFADVPHLELAGLAGQRGFFDWFDVSFRFRDGTFELSPEK